MHRYHIFAYPNIWEETSCISAIEALGSGLHAIVTNYGALYETCSEWPTYVQYDRNYENLARCFAVAAPIPLEPPVTSTIDFMETPFAV